MKAVFCRALGCDAVDPALAAERVFPCFSSPVPLVIPGARLRAEAKVHALDLSRAGEKRFSLATKEAGLYWLFTEHLPEEFGLELLDARAQRIAPQVSRRFSTGHSHEQAVGSFCLETERPVDLERFRRWPGREMQLNGANIYRMKGFLNFKGHDERIVVQAVHMLVDNTSLGPGGDGLGARNWCSLARISIVGR